MKSLDDKLKEAIGSVESAARDYERGGEVSVLYEVENLALDDIKQAFYDQFKIEFVKDESVSYSGDMLALIRRVVGIKE